MFKKITLTLFLFIIILAIIPYGVGFFVKNRLVELASSINQHNPSIDLAIDYYHQGWFSSNIRWKFSVKVPENTTPKQTALLVLNQNVMHGPIVYDPSRHFFTIAWAAIANELDLESSIKQLMPEDIKALIDQIKIKSNDVLHFGNVYESNISIQPFKVAIPQRYNVDFGGLTSELSLHLADWRYPDRIDINTQQKLTTFTLPYPSIQTLTIQPISKVIHLVKTEPDSFIWNKDLDVVLDGINLNFNNENTFALDHLVFKNHGKLFNIHYNENVEINLSKISAPAAVLFPLSAGLVKLDILNLKASGLNQFLMKIEEAAKKNFLPLTAYNATQWANELSSQVIDAQTEVKFLLQFKTESGPYHFDALIRWPNLNSADNIPILDKTKLSGKIQAASKLVDQLIDTYAENLSNNYLPKNKISTISPAVSSSRDESVDIKPSAGTEIPLPENASFPEVVAYYLKEGKINYTISMKLLELKNQEVTSAEFENYLKNEALDSAVIENLKQSYRGLPISKPAVPSAVVATSDAKPLTAASSSGSKEIAKQLLNQWIQEGYIVKNNTGDYIIVIEADKTGLKLNGKLIPNSFIYGPGTKSTITNENLNPTRTTASTSVSPNNSSTFTAVP